MKSETFILVNEEVRDNLIKRIMEIDCDGKTKVTIGNVGTKSDRQHKLDWKWSGEIFKSGIGHGDKSVIETHARSKWLFALPILLAGDDELFIALHNYFMSTYGHDPDKCIEYAETRIRTKELSVKQASEYMNNKMHYWISKGVNLTSPASQGL